MDFSDLKTLEAVARHGSMSGAASELHTVQSNVTARIRALEEELGVTLFQRHARGVVPTPAALRMLPFAGRIARLMADARAAAKDEGIPSGTLQIGAMETTAALRLSPRLIAFTRRYPDVRFVLRTGPSAKLLRDVVESRLEGALIAGPVSHPELEQDVIFKEELVLVTSTKIRSTKELNQDIGLKTVVFQFGCAYRQRLESYLAGMGIVAVAPLEFGSLDMIVACVSAGVGVSLLPKSLVLDAAKEGTIAIHRLPREQAMVETLFVRRKDGYVSSALSSFLAMMKETQGDLRRA